jgi:hypothetical protein
MKIEKQENSIRLIPENDWEKSALKELSLQRQIESMQFQDDWDLKGYLQLNFPSRDWGR